MPAPCYPNTRRFPAAQCTLLSDAILLRGQLLDRFIVSANRVLTMNEMREFKRTETLEHHARALREIARAVARVSASTRVVGMDRATSFACSIKS